MPAAPLLTDDEIARRLDGLPGWRLEGGRLVRTVTTRGFRAALELVARTRIDSPIMVAWKDFADEAPRIAEIFERRHRATGNLCLLATIRADGSPRISPMEPRIFEGMLVLVGMRGTTKYRDLARDPRFCLHTATIDPNVGDGDVKVWGHVIDMNDQGLSDRFTDFLYKETGFDLRGQRFDPFYVGDLTSASSLEFIDGHLRVSIWKPGEGERVTNTA